MNFRSASDHYRVEVLVKSDAEAIASSVEQPDEFVVIFDRHFQSVFRFLARRFGADAAADLADETFTRAFAQRARYRPARATALPWLLGIATRVGANERRREARRLRAYASVTPAGPAAGKSAFDGRSPIAEELAKLTGADRDALLLFTWADLTYAEIADALAIPVGTVRSRINRARTQLRAALSTPAVDGM